MVETIVPVDLTLENTVNNNPDLLNDLANVKSHDAFMHLASTFATETGIPFRHDEIAIAISEKEMLNPFNDMDHMMKEKDYNNAAGISDIEASFTDRGSSCDGTCSMSECGDTTTETGRYCQCPTPTTKTASCTCGLFCW